MQAHRDPVHYLVALGVIGSLTVVYPPLAILLVTLATIAALAWLLLQLTRPAETGKVSEPTRALGDGCGLLVLVLVFAAGGVGGALVAHLFAYFCIASVISMLDPARVDLLAGALSIAVESLLLFGALYVVVRATRQEPQARVAWIAGGLGWIGTTGYFSFVLAAVYFG